MLCCVCVLIHELVKLFSCYCLHIDYVVVACIYIYMLIRFMCIIVIYIYIYGIVCGIYICIYCYVYKPTRLHNPRESHDHAAKAEHISSRNRRSRRTQVAVRDAVDQRFHAGLLKVPISLYGWLATM